jgi:hypothetical protein
MQLSQRSRAIAAVASLSFVVSLAAGQTPPSSGTSDVIPKDASALEGVPTVRLDVTSQETKRQELDRKRAAAQALKIEIVDGRYYWTSRDNRPLTLTKSGEFTYLTSAEPGRYVRFRKINDRISYVEHVDMEFGSVTYWGELRIVVGRNP